VSAGVETSLLGSMGASADSTRIAGNDRYETAGLIADEVARLGGNPDNAAFIARGDAFPDALAGSPLAFAHRTPILLTATKSLSPATDAAIHRLGIRTFYVLGSEGAVGKAVWDSLADTALSRERWQGTDRYKTAAAIATNGALKGWVDWRTAGVALGTDFPDALGGGVWLGRRHGVLLLTTKTPLQPTTRSTLAAEAGPTLDVRVFGGVPSIPDGTMGEIVTAFP
jgi:putative cell wall-binding protein